MSKIIQILVFCAMLTLPRAVLADTVYCTNCSNTALQSLQHALASSSLAELKAAYTQYVQQTAHQIQMVQQNIEQYANMVQNTLQLPAAVISEISGELSKLSQITSAINTLRNDITGMANVFDQLYRTQDEVKKLANMPKELLSGRNTTYRGYWDDWAKRVDESTKATFQLSGKQLQELENSGKLQDYINKLLSTPEGQQQALMAGNQLAALQIQESRQLRELIATKFQSDLSSQNKQEKQGQYGEELSRKMNDFEGVNFKPVEDPAF